MSQVERLSRYQQFKDFQKKILVATKKQVYFFKVFSRNFLKVDGSEVNKYLLLPNGNASVLNMGLGRDQTESQSRHIQNFQDDKNIYN